MHIQLRTANPNEAKVAPGSKHHDACGFELNGAAFAAEWMIPVLPIPRVKITSDRRKIIGAAVFAAAALLLFLLFPEMLRPGWAGLLLPLFAAGVIAGLLLVVQSAHILIRLALKIAALFACVFLLMHTVELLAGGSLPQLARQNPAAFLSGCLILLCFLAVPFAVAENTSLALRCLVVLTAAYSCINYFSLQFRGTPFLPGDVTAAGTALGVLSNYTAVMTWQLAESLLIYAGIFLFAPKTRLPRAKPLAGGILRIVSLAVSATYLFVTASSQHIARWGYYPNYWDQNVSAAENGSLVNFAANIPDLFFSPPEGYSPELVREIAAPYHSDSAGEAAVKPDVILVMGESWANMAPGALTRTNVPVMPFLSGLGERENGVYGNLIVSAYGGGTSLSEYQMLTGTSAEYGMHPAPFQLHVHEALPSIVRSFGRLGYGTTALHTGNADAWRRDKAFPLLGFDRFLDYREFAEPDSRYTRYYLSDEAMYNKVLSLLDQGDQPQFIYAITIQTHGGYDIPTYQSPIRITEPEGDFPRAEQFLGLMHESDRDFQRFIGELEKRQRPTVVLAYGDHLPLVDDGYIEYLEAAWNGQGVAYGDYDLWHYETFFALWANFPLANDAREPPPYVSLNYLGAYLMRSAGLPLTGYQKFLLEGMAQFPVASLAGFMTSDGDYIQAWNARETQLYFRQAVLQYNLIHDRENYPEQFYDLAP